MKGRYVFRQVVNYTDSVEGITPVSDPFQGCISTVGAHGKAEVQWGPGVHVIIIVRIPPIPQNDCVILGT